MTIYKQKTVRGYNSYPRTKTNQLQPRVVQTEVESEPALFLPVNPCKLVPCPWREEERGSQSCSPSEQESITSSSRTNPLRAARLCCPGVSYADGGASSTFHLQLPTGDVQRLWDAPAKIQGCITTSCSHMSTAPSNGAQLILLLAPAAQ